MIFKLVARRPERLFGYGEIKPTVDEDAKLLVIDPKTFEANSKDRVIIFRKPNFEGIHIEDVKLVNGEWLITGKSGVVLIVTGFGISVKQAQAQAYQRVKNVLIPNMYYRTDIGDRWFEDHDKLHTWGYLREN